MIEIAKVGYFAGMGGRTYKASRVGEDLALWRPMFISMTRLLNRVEGDVKAAHDLTLLDLGILLALHHRDDAVPMGSLAAIFGVDPSVITYRLKRLEARGLAKRTTGAGDRRFTFARSTPAGRVKLPDMLRSMLASARRNLLSKLEPAEVPVLAKVFIRLQEVQQTAAVSVVEVAPVVDEAGSRGKLHEAARRPAEQKDRRRPASRTASRPRHRSS